MTENSTQENHEENQSSDDSSSKIHLNPVKLLMLNLVPEPKESHG